MDSTEDIIERCYLDWAASAPYDVSLFNSNDASQTIFGNPSSQHREGQTARKALERYRERCAVVLGVLPEQLVFTSGGTESNHIVLDSLLLRSNAGLALSQTEHPSIKAKADILSRLGVPLFWIKPESTGSVAPEQTKKTIAKHTSVRMIACMAVNNETGAMTDIEKVTQAVHAASATPIHFHCDAVQAIGKLAFSLNDIDSLSISAHKLGGPKGLGLLFLRRPIETFNRGGGQERGIRPGTENLIGASLVATLLERFLEPNKLKLDRLAAEERFSHLISFLHRSERCALIPSDRMERDARFSPFILQFAIRGIPGEVLVRVLDDMGIAVSTGSACSSRSRKRPVLESIGIDATTAFEAIRVSQGRSSAMCDIERLIDALEKIMRRL